GVIGGVAAVALVQGLDDVFSGFGGHALGGVLVVKLLFFASVALHQLVHGLACVHYRRRVREFGFAFLHGFVPTFYVDVTDIFIATRGARVVTAVSGALVHLVLGAVAFLVAAYAPVGSFAQAFAAASGIIQWQALAISLYPFGFIGMDGYHVFVDLLGVPAPEQRPLVREGAARGPGTAPLGVARSALARLRRALGGLDRGVSRLQRLDRRARGLLTLRLPRPAARPRS